MKGRKVKRKRKVEGIDPFMDCRFLPKDFGISLREFHSRVIAEAEHGEELVQKAYDWLDGLARKKDPRAREIYARVMAGPHPYGALVDFFLRHSLVGDVVRLPPSLDGLRR